MKSRRVKRIFDDQFRLSVLKDTDISSIQSYTKYLTFGTFHSSDDGTHWE